ncbi:MAG: hypothetical protein Q7V57_14340 [Actinomycetota bacterium]|nr:hypothetical protein [Actinomycetota bacterium]
MSTDLERRLRVTFDEMIPQLIEQVGVVDVVDAPPVGRRWVTHEVRDRRWVGVGALAVAACVVAIAFVVGRDDRSGTIGGTDTTVASTTAVPAWYPLLRAAVPERFEYLALTAVGLDGITFVAIDPNDGKALEIVVTGGSAPAVEVTCDVDKGQAPFAVTPPRCDTGNDSQVEPAELEQISAAVPGAELLSVSEWNANAIDPQAMLALLASQLGDAPQGFEASASDYTFELGAQDAIRTRVRVLTSVYPRPATRVVGQVGYYGGLPALWAISPTGYAVRLTSATSGVTTVVLLQSVAVQVLDAVANVPLVPTTSTTSTLSIVAPDGLDATYGPITLGDGTSISLQVGASGICTLLADGQVGGCDGLTAYDMPVIVLWGSDYESSLQTVYGIVQVGHSLSVTKGDGSPDTPVALTPPQDGWSAYAFQQPVGSRTTDAEGNNVDFRPLCC